jgi:TolA-binding protein
MGVFRVVRHVPPFHLVLVLILLAFSLPACVVGDFLGTYFNTYYNASNLFSQAEEEIWGQADTKLTGGNLLAISTIPGGARTKLTSVVEKCSKLLQNHPTSMYVDDALLMIGKAFYYQGDYTRAERKFKELQETYPNSGLIMESRVWMAYSEYKENNLSTAEQTSTRVLKDAKEAGDRKSESYAAMLLGRIHADRADYATSSTYYSIAGAEAVNSDLRASAFFTAGDMYLSEGDSTDALAMYVKAGDETSNYLNEYRAMLGQARALARLGRGEESLQILSSLRGNGNYKEYWGEVDLETGNTYRRMRHYPDAIAQYHYVDTAYARSDYAANADYQLGQIFETVAGDYDSARVAYNRGKAAGGQATTVALNTGRAELMNRYARYHSTIILNDSLLAAALARKDSLAMEAADDSARSKPPDSLALRADSVKPAPPPPKRIPIDTLHARLASAINELATLFYVEFALPDSAVAWYDTLLSRYPRTANTPRAWYAIAQVVYAQDSVNGRRAADSLYRLIVEHYPNTDFAVEARRLLGLPPVAHIVDPGEREYHRAEQTLLAGNFQVALDSMVEIVRGHPTSPFASRAEYAAGWLYEEKLSQPDSALATYQRLMKAYPSSEYAALVRPKVETALAERAQLERKAAEEARARELAAQKEKTEKAEKDSLRALPAVRNKTGEGPASREEAIEKAKAGIPPSDTTNLPPLLRRRLKEEALHEDSTHGAFPRPPGADSAKAPPDLK